MFSAKKAYFEICFLKFIHPRLINTLCPVLIIGPFHDRVPKNSVPNPLHWLLSQTAKVIWDHKEDGIEQIALPRAIETSVSQLLMPWRGPNMDWGEVQQWRWLQDENPREDLPEPTRKIQVAGCESTHVNTWLKFKQILHIHAQKNESQKHKAPQVAPDPCKSWNLSKWPAQREAPNLAVFDGSLNLTRLCKSACLMCIAALPLVLHQLEANRMALKICGESNLLWQTRLPLKIQPSGSYSREVLDDFNKRSQCWKHVVQK